MTIAIDNQGTIDTNQSRIGRVLKKQDGQTTDSIPMTKAEINSFLDFYSSRNLL